MEALAGNFSESPKYQDREQQARARVNVQDETTPFTDLAAKSGPVARVLQSRGNLSAGGVGVSIDYVGAHERQPRHRRKFPGSWPVVGLQNFADLFTSGEFLRAIGITAQFLALMLAATLVVGLLIALILKYDSRLARFTQSMLIMVWMTPPVVIGTLWKFLAASDGVINAVLTWAHVPGAPIPVFSEPHFALWAVVGVVLWVTLPFASLILKAALLDVPQDMLEAARSDGAGALRMLWHVVLPTIRPVLLIVAVLTIIFSFKAFEFIYVLTEGGPGHASTTLPYLGYIFAFESNQFGRGAAVGLIAVGFTVLFAVVYAFTIRKEEAAQ